MSMSTITLTLLEAFLPVLAGTEHDCSEDELFQLWETLDNEQVNPSLWSYEGEGFFGRCVATGARGQVIEVTFVER